MRANALMIATIHSVGAGTNTIATTGGMNDDPPRPRARCVVCTDRAEFNTETRCMMGDYGIYSDGHALSDGAEHDGDDWHDDDELTEDDVADKQAKAWNDLGTELRRMGEDDDD